MELGQLHAFVAFHGLEDEAGYHLDGVGTLLVDVVARVAAYESLQLATQEELAGAGSLALDGELSLRVAATGTRHEDLALVLRVQVDEVVARHEVGLHALGTRQSRLLVACEHALYGAVGHVTAVEQGQLYSAANTVVGSQRRPLGGQPLAVDIGADGVAVEVELHVHQLVAHHVHVALQNHRLAVLHARCGRFAYDDVARLVHLRVQSTALAPRPQILNHLLLALRWAGNFVNLRKLFEHNCGF